MLSFDFADYALVLRLQFLPFFFVALADSTLLPHSLHRHAASTTSHPTQLSWRLRPSLTLLAQAAPRRYTSWSDNTLTLIATAAPAHVPSVPPRRPTSTHSHHRWESNTSQPSSACRGDDDDAAARPGYGSGSPCRAPTTTVAEGWSPVRQSKFRAALL
ncbi:hypothetical protein EDB89DRAFT_1938800 [Lactarius sanguifluus]|nr:hypothetical protein EDB89DRAFT_1938800 [Lactarius sanguifluus]